MGVTRSMGRERELGKTAGNSSKRSTRMLKYDE